MIETKMFILVALVAVGWGNLSLAQESSPPQRLPLEKAISIAMANHPRIARSRLESQGAEQGVRTARSGYYPWISIDGIAKDGLSGAAAGLGLTGLPGSPVFDQVALALNFRITAYDFGRTGNQVDQAKFTAASLRSSEEAEKAAIGWQVKTTYYCCLQAEELLRVARETLEARKLTARQAQVYYDAELRSKLDFNLSLVRVKESEAELVRAENQRQLGFAALNRAMGVSGRPTYQLGPASSNMASVPSIDELIDLALASRPDLQAVNLEAQAAEAALGAVRSEKMPRITAVASAGYARFEPGVDGQPWVVGVGLSVPLFQGFALESRIQHTQALLGVAEAAKQEWIQAVRFEVQSAHLELGSARAVARAARAQVSLAEEAFRLATQRYGAQLGSFLDLAESEVALSRAKQQNAQATYDFLIARATLEFVVGEGLELSAGFPNDDPLLEGGDATLW